MTDRLKRYGEMCAAGAAMWAVVVFLTGLVGGHLPPWATVAWASSVEQSLTNDDFQIKQLNTLLLSDKVAAISAALAKNPGDVNLQQSYLYWSNQLRASMAATLPKK